MVLNSNVAITVRGLTKHYPSKAGANRALDGIDLEVKTGSVTALLGPNGAGKTTTVRILTTLIRPTAGTATVVGRDVVRDATELKSLIGASGQYAAVDEDLTGRENLEMVGRLYHLGARASRARATELLERFDLADAADRPVKGYSGGMRRRLDLAGAIVVNPQVLFLDEPTTGLDPRARLGLWDVIEELVATGTTLLLTTQYMDEAERLADQIAVLDRGKIIARGTGDELKAQVGGERIEIQVADIRDVDRAVDEVSGIAAADVQVDRENRQLTIPVATNSKGAAVLVETLARLAAADIEIDDVGLRRPTLDDVFLSLTGHQAQSEQQAQPDHQAEAR